MHFKTSSHESRVRQDHTGPQSQIEGGSGSSRAASARAGNASVPQQIFWHNRHVVARNVVHTEVNEHKPFSMWKLKYKDLTAADKAFSARPVSIGIAASGPYISQYKHDRLEYMKSKLKWVGDKDSGGSLGRPAAIANQVLASTAVGNM